MKTLLFLLVPLMLSHAVEVPPPPVDKLDAESCEGLGFTQALACSTCKNIEDIVANEGTSATGEVGAVTILVVGAERMSLWQYTESPHRRQVHIGVCALLLRCCCHCCDISTSTYRTAVLFVPAVLSPTVLSLRRSACCRPDGGVPAMLPRDEAHCQKGEVYY